MKNKLIEVSFDGLLELDYLNLLEEQVKENPESIMGDALIYDEHRVLLVAAFTAKDFLRAIHFPKSSADEKDEHLYLHLEFWQSLIAENVVMPATPGFIGTPTSNQKPTDMYLCEIYENMKFKGYIAPKDYPFLTHVNGNPYVPSWHVLRWANKALRILEERMREAAKEDDQSVQ